MGGATKRSKDASRSGRKKRLYMRKAHERVTLSCETLRVAVRQLLEAATAYEASEGNRNFADVGFAATAPVLGSKRALEDIINALHQHGQARETRVGAIRLARWLSELCTWLKNPASAAMKEGDVVDEPYLRTRIREGFAFWQLPTLPEAALEELVALTSFVAASRRTSRRSQNAKAEGTLRKRVASILRKHKVTDFSADTLFDMVAATRGRPRKAGSIKSREQADAIWENSTTNPAELVLYVLLLLTGGERTPLVDESMEALRRVVARAVPP